MLKIFIWNPWNVEDIYFINLFNSKHSLVILNAVFCKPLLFIVLVSESFSFVCVISEK